MQPAETGRAHCVYMPVFFYHKCYGLITIYPQAARPQDHPLAEVISTRLQKKKKRTPKHSHADVILTLPALFMGNFEFFSATTLTQGIFSALISTADRMYTDL